MFVISTNSEAAAKNTASAAAKSKTLPDTDNILTKETLSSMRITLSSGREKISLGDRTVLTLTGTKPDGSVMDLSLLNVDYTSSDESILSIEKSNNMIILTGKAIGEAYVIANISIEDVVKTASIRVQVSKITNSKTRSTYYTPEKIEAARNNILKYKWAKSIRDSAVGQAEKYLKLGYDGLWNLVTPQSIPRSYAVNQTLGCPVCGKKIFKYGQYPYLSDPVNSPWKLECPYCHTKFPTNDFKAYYESGKNKQGIFDPKLANKSLLQNTLYPEKGKSWGVDDGNGFIDSNGKKYTFIAYYNHWSLWYNGIIEKALNSFRDAYIYTGDLRYARAGIILLDRIADVYPDMDISKYKASNGFLNSNGGSNLGKVLGSIWETDLTKDLLKAYDAFFPAMDDYEAVKFLKDKSIAYNLKAIKKSGTEIKRNIEDGIVRQIYPAVKKAQIRGNNGMHQSTLALAAVVLDTFPETKEWLDFDFQVGASSNTAVTGGNILASLINNVDRDGNGNEVSPTYNKLWLSQYIEVANILNGYDLYPAADLYKNVKFRKMFYATLPLILSDNYSANIGDSGYTGSPSNYLDKEQYKLAFEHFQDPVLAQVIYFLNGNKVDNLQGDIFLSNPENISDNIRKMVETYGTLKLNSTNSTGYGFAALRDGKGKIDFEHTDKPSSSQNNTQRSLWLYYGSNQGHGHFDTLNIGMTAFKLDLMPDLGYPEFADDSPNRMEWVRNTISHNTVVVDKARQAPEISGQPKHFDDSEMVKLIDVEAPNAYPKISLYKRTVAMIKVDDENSYAVDFFHVNGGSDHYYSFHGAEGEVATEGLNLAPQVDESQNPVGSYAGLDIPFGIRPSNDSLPGFLYTGSGFQWLYNVKKDSSPADSFSVDYKLKDTWNVYGKGFGADTDIHLRMTMLSKVDDVAITDGDPPQNNSRNPRSLKYIVAHKSGQNLNSLFTTIIEPYKAERYVTTASAVSLKINGQPVSDNTAKAVKVVLKNGRIDYIVSSLDSSTTYTVDDKFQFKGFFGVYSVKNDREFFTYLNDGSFIGKPVQNSASCLSGTVEDFTKELSLDNEITVKFNDPPKDPNELIGKFLYAENDLTRNAAYEIKSIKKVEGNSFTFGLGDITPIRCFSNINDFTKGYVFDLFYGAKFTIPLTKTFIAP